MPRFDQTGPEGQGPMTGRKMGRCTGNAKDLKKTENNPSGEQNDKSAENTRGGGFGFRRGQAGAGRGRGMGRQNRFRGGQ